MNTYGHVNSKDIFLEKYSINKVLNRRNNFQVKTHRGWDGQRLIWEREQNKSFSDLALAQVTEELGVQNSIIEAILYCSIWNGTLTYSPRHHS